MDPDKTTALLEDLLNRENLTGAEVTRESIRVWTMSGVQRLRLPAGNTMVFKYAAGPFVDEPQVLRHAAHHGVPVPRVHDAVTMYSPHSPAENYMGMLMEDLGQPSKDATIGDAAAAAVAIHTVPPMHGRPVLHSATLAELPGRALAQLAELQSTGRWLDERIMPLLHALDTVAPDRARDAEIPPYGMVHSEFHPTSLLVDEVGRCRVLDMARGCTGPGLLDLMSWQGTTTPPTSAALRELLHAYVAAGGDQRVLADRAGLPAQAWALGWHRVWICQWYIEQALLWMPDPASDAAGVAVVVRHLTEAAGALRA